MISLQIGKATQISAGEPALFFPVKAATGRNKQFLALFVHPRRHGIEVLEGKPVDANAAGNLAAVCRTWGQWLNVARILLDSEQRTWWVVLGSDPANPLACIRLVGGTAPELSLIELHPESCVRMRLSTTGIYTKRRPVEGPLPHEIFAADRSAFDRRFEDLTEEFEARLLHDTHEDSGAVVESRLLPVWQRDARDRLARRIKTLRKSLLKRRSELPAPESLVALQEEALALSEANGGKAIDAAFNQFKKAKKTAALISTHVKQLEVGLLDAEKDLVRLRERTLSSATVNEILGRHGVRAKQSETKRNTANPMDSRRGPQGCHEFLIKGNIRVLVAKDARSGDSLVKSAAANDWWLHVVDGTGSHVIVPAAQENGVRFSADLSDHVVRAAGILAVHNSRWRETRSAEVYLTRKSALRKRKADPPGLWQVSRSKTVMIRYEEEDLSFILQCRK